MLFEFLGELHLNQISTLSVDRNLTRSDYSSENFPEAAWNSWTDERAPRVAVDANGGMSGGRPCRFPIWQIPPSWGTPAPGLPPDSPVSEDAILRAEKPGPGPPVKLEMGSGPWVTYAPETGSGRAPPPGPAFSLLSPRSGELLIPPYYFVLSIQY